MGDKSDKEETEKSWSPCKRSTERAQISKQIKWIGHGKNESKGTWVGVSSC